MLSRSLVGHSLMDPAFQMEVMRESNLLFCSFFHGVSDVSTEVKVKGQPALVSHKRQCSPGRTGLRNLAEELYFLLTLIMGLLHQLWESFMFFPCLCFFMCSLGRTIPLSSGTGPENEINFCPLKQVKAFLSNKTRGSFKRIIL